MKRGDIKDVKSTPITVGVTDTQISALILPALISTQNSQQPMMGGIW